MIDEIITFAEMPFLINGVKSWIHCLIMDMPYQEIRGPLTHHTHDYIELLYALDTDAYVWQNGKKYKFDSGHLFIVNSNEPHTLTFNRNSKYICIKFLPQILYADENSLFEFKYVLPFLLENSKQKRVFYKDELGGTDIHKLILEIMEEWQNKRPAYELVIRANILKLFTGVFRYWQIGTSSNESYVTDVVKTAIEYLENNFDNTTEEDVAKYCNVSYNYFSYVFKKTMGKTFSEYITYLKLREAEKLLLSTDKSITEIALCSGFSTSSYFIYKFRIEKGITPRQFRENIKQKSADLKYIENDEHTIY
ncbi:MAG: helix-turn-helix transcriptional regulator [Clostridia bacterium]|nr:helix-turn-helix transcriptional regulator [Clostridia bacterium]